MIVPKECAIKATIDSENCAIARIEKFIIENFQADTVGLDKEATDALYAHRVEYSQYFSASYDKFFQHLKDLDLVSGRAYLREDLALVSKFKAESDGGLIDIGHFKYIDQIVDLNDKNVCKLLPYLLAAYTCHVSQNSLMSRGTLSADFIFNSSASDSNAVEESLSPIHMKQIQQLSKRFSFRDHRINPPKQPNRRYSLELPDGSIVERPKPYFVNGKGPFHDVEFVYHIFASWAAITTYSSTKDTTAIKEVKDKIDLRACYALYLYHISPEVLGDLNDFELKDMASNRTLRHNFQMEFEHKMM